MTFITRLRDRVNVELQSGTALWCFWWDLDCAERTSFALLLARRHCHSSLTREHVTPMPRYIHHLELLLDPKRKESHLPDLGIACIQSRRQLLH